MDPPTRFSMDILDNWAYLGIDLRNNLVRNIEIVSYWGMFPNKLNSLGVDLWDVVNLYGYPSIIIIGRGCGGDVTCDNLNLVYYKNGIIAAVETNFEPDIKISETLPLRKLTFLDPQDFPKFLLSYFDLQ
jgi:hypothetical protein